MKKRDSLKLWSNFVIRNSFIFLRQISLGKIMIRFCCRLVSNPSSFLLYLSYKTMQMDLEQKIIGDAQIPEQQTKDGLEDAPNESEFTDLYLSSMKFYSNLVDRQFSLQFKQKLSKEKIEFNQNQFEKDFTISIKETSINKEMAVLCARWGKIQMNINILNIQQENQHRDDIAAGSFSNIYAGKFMDKTIAMKCIPIRQQISRWKAVREWFLLKIASIAEIGPKVETCCGFDLFMYANCIQFPMELCCSSINFSINERDLYWNMAVMHSLNLVHCDIKPENIMFSPAHKKAVFIDFGLSKFIKEKIGERSLTSFVGNINFCGKEMQKLIFKDIKGKVDLYYNDLTSLQGSIRSIKQKYREDQDEDEFKCQIPYENWLYLSKYLLTFYIFKEKIEDFFTFWGNFQKKYNLSVYRRSAFEALQELHPTQKRKDFFWRFAIELDTDTTEFLKVKIAYEISQQNICSFSLLVVEKRLTIFSSYLSSIYKGNTMKEQQKCGNLLIDELILNADTLKNIPRKKYVETYMSYMSYFNNICNANQTSRQRAARVYYLLSIGPLPQGLKGRKLVQATIRHILSWGLTDRGFRADCRGFTVFAFKIYEFLSILDIGTPEQFFHWLDDILRHPSLPLKFKRILLNRIHYSNYLNEHRVSKKGEMSRVEFIISTELWLKKIYSTFDEISEDIQEYCISKEESLTLSTLQLSVHYISRKICRQFQLTKTLIQEQLSCFINQIIHETSRKQLTFFLILAFSKLYFFGNQPSSCKLIYEIFKKNVADQSIIDQFSFKFEINIAQQLNVATQIDTKIFYKDINEYLLTVDNQNLIFFERILLILYDKIILQNETKFIESIRGDKNMIFWRFLESVTLFYCRHLTSKKNAHVCIQQLSIFNILLVQKSLRISLRFSAKQLYDQSFIDQVQCFRCHCILQMNRTLSTLQDLFTQWHSLAQTNSSQKHRTLNEIADEITFVEGYFDRNRQISHLQLQKYDFWITNLQKAKRFLQLICCKDPSLQQQFHGILNFYHFAVKNNKLSSYFVQFKNSFSILNTLCLLKSTDNQHVDFLCRMAAFLGTNLQLKNYEIVYQYCTNFFLIITEEEFSELFYRLKERQDQEVNILIVYASMIGVTGSTRLERGLAAQILKRVHRIFFKFQRQILTRMFIKMLFLARKESGERGRRKLRFVNNRLVKNEMVSGKTMPRRYRDFTLNPKGLLYKKMHRIQKMPNFTKFMMKI